MTTRTASTGRGSQDPPALVRSETRPAAQARTLGFPRAGRRLPRLLYVYVATAPRSNAAPSLALVDAAGRVLDRIPLDRLAHRGAHTANPTPAARPQIALRGIVYALWNARRLGYRSVVVHCDDPDTVAQLNGERPVDAEATGLYLEARALMHLYSGARIDVGELVLSPVGPAANAVLTLWERARRAAATPASF